MDIDNGELTYEELVNAKRAEIMEVYSGEVAVFIRDIKLRDIDIVDGIVQQCCIARRDVPTKQKYYIRKLNKKLREDLLNVGTNLIIH